jgi:hypothetical protein
MLYCPMCGTRFKVGNPLCPGCAAPLPVAPPDTRSMDNAARERSSGLSLAWSEMGRGFGMVLRRPHLLVLPLLLGFIIAGIVQYNRAKMFNAMPGGFFGRGNPGGVGNTVASWGWMHLTPSVMITHVSRASQRYTLPIRPIPIMEWVGWQNPIFQFRPGSMVAALWTLAGIYWLFGLIALLMNLFLWRMMVTAIYRQRGERRNSRFHLNTGLIIAVLLLSLDAPVSTVMTPILVQQGIQPVFGLFLLVFHCVLSTWACALTYAGKDAPLARTLMREVLLTPAGLFFLFETSFILMLAHYMIDLWQAVALPLMNWDLFSLNFLWGFLIFGLAAFLITGATQGLFCFMDALSRRPETSALAAISAEGAAG